MSTIGKRIREYRKIRNITIENMAEQLDVSKNYVGDLERDRCLPRFNHLMAISEILETDLNDLCQDYISKTMPIEANFYARETFERMSRMTDWQKKLVLQHIDDLIEFNK